MKPRRALVSAVFAACVFMNAHAATPRPETPPVALAITHVNVLPMTSNGESFMNASVVIEGNRVSSINGPVPKHAKVIDGKGKWLIPGLIDMHVHVPTDGHFNTSYPTRTAAIFTSTQDVMTPFIANGVTTIFELISQPGHFGQRNEILRGDVVGPRMSLCAAILQNKWLTANKNHLGTSARRVARLQKMVAFNELLVKAFKEEGVPMVAGTDAGSSGVVWGFSLHDELGLLVDAGLTAEEALTSATRLPAIWLGIDQVVGTVEVGKYADLVLLDANPLHDIANTRKIRGVFVNGRWLDKKQIGKMLSELAGRNAASKDKFDWARRGEL